MSIFGNGRSEAIVLASALWVFLTLGLVAAIIYVQFRRLRAQAQGSGSGGIGAVSFGISELFAVIVLFLPPVVLFLAWLSARRT